MALRIAALAVADHPRWLELARGYKVFYKTQDHNAAARLLYNKVAKYNHFIRYDYPLQLAVV
jgi:hypothetical protein